MRRFALTVLMAGALSLVGGEALAQPAHRDGEGNNFPAVIELPDGFQPEGISIGRGTSFYVGSLATGAIYRGDVRTGNGSVLVAGTAGGFAVGTEVDRRNRLWVAGGPTGSGRVYDATTGKELASYNFLAGTPGLSTFVNDVVVTNDAAYFTDSVNPFLYVVPLSGGRLPAAADVERLALTGALVYQPGFNVNGIEASPDGRTLLVIQSNTGLLYTVSARTGVAGQVDLGATSLPFGDGLLRKGSTLYVVKNQLNRIAVIDLGRSYASGKLIDTITSPNFQVPTTVAALGRSLYAVNARFGTMPTPTTEYTVVRVSAR